MSKVWLGMNGKDSEWVILFHLSHLFIYVPLLKKLLNPGGTGDVKDGNDPETTFQLLYIYYINHIGVFQNSIESIAWVFDW